MCNDIEIICNEIKRSIYLDNIQFNNSIVSLFSILNENKYTSRTFNDWIEYWEKLFENLLDENFNIKEKIIFLLRTSIVDNKNIHDDIKKYIFPRIIRKYILKYQYDILDILKEDVIQTMYSNWFKVHEKNFDQENKIYKDIFNLPKFKEIVLNDYSFVVDLFQFNFKSRIQFIPNDCGYLIGAINSYSLSNNELFKLYNKYFNNKLNKFEILNLVHSHGKIDEKNKLLNNDIKYMKQQYVYTLKDIYDNPKYLKLLQKLSKKFDISLKDMMLFSSKYKNTQMFINLYSLEKKHDMTKKIKYLAASKPIKNMHNIKSLDDVSINDLISMEKQEDINIRVYGGPNSSSKKNTTFFNDSYEREIRRINFDGTYKIMKLSSTISHFEGVKNIYKDYNIDKKENSSINISIEVAKNLNSITFIIEKEICFIIMSSTISEIQEDVFINWLHSSNKKGKLAIVIYNNDTNKKEVINNENMSIKEIINYINYFKSKNNRSL